MHGSFFQQDSTRYWLKVYLLYIAFEACVQLFFFLTLNIYSRRISDIELHFIMWLFQSVFVLPIWYVGYLFRQKAIWLQVIANTVFFIGYTFFWYDLAMGWLAQLHVQLQEITQPGKSDKIIAVVDTWSAFYYQLLKHAWRLGWFFVADFFYHYKKEEKQRLELIVANKELQLGLIKWHLNPAFYFKTIETIAKRAESSPAACSGLILNLSKVMEYVIYRSGEKMIPVAEEIAFLQNYLSLQNLDKESGSNCQITVSGDHSNLLVIPLLLVSLYESQLPMEKDGDKDKCMTISFSGHVMKVNGQAFQHGKGRALHPSLQLRLDEFYQNRYRFANGARGMSGFEIQLNEFN